MLLQLFEVLPFGQADVAALFGEQRQVEVCEAHVRLGGERFPDEPFRAIAASPAAGR